MKNYPRILALLIACLSCTLLPVVSVYALIDVNGDQVIAQNGDSFTDTDVLINDSDIARITGGSLTLTNSPGFRLVDSGRFIMTGGVVDLTGEIQANRNQVSGNVGFEIHGGVFNINENNSVNLNMPFAVNGRGGDSCEVIVSGGELHLGRLQLSDRGGANSGVLYSFTQTGGLTNSRTILVGTAPSTADVFIEISGGQFISDNYFGINEIDSATFHVNGSGATTIHFAGDLVSTANTEFKFTLDSSGVTPIDLNNGTDDSLAGTVNLELDGVTPTPSATYTLFTANSGGDIYGILSLDSADASDWMLQVNGNDLEAVYIGTPLILDIQPSNADTTITTKLDTNNNPFVAQRPNNGTEPRVGRMNNNAENWVYVMPFQLPELKGGTISSAELTINIAGQSNGAHNTMGNLDLYARTSCNYSLSMLDLDHYVEAYNPTNPNVQLITDNFCSQADMASANYGIKSSGDIVAYIQNLYDLGYQPGAYVYFILANDEYPNGSKYYNVSTADSSNPPLLSISISGAKTDGQAWGTTDSLSSNGVTWDFSQPVAYGTFVNGDYWVVGPVTITNISNGLNHPDYTQYLSIGQNGSMINPLSPGMSRGEQGYDDTLDSYNPDLNAGLIQGNRVSPTYPLTVAPDSTLLSSVSWLYENINNTEPGTPSFNKTTKTPRPVLRSMGTLTVLDSAPADYSFRPPYAGTDKSVNFQFSDLDFSKLLNLDPVGSNVPNPNELISRSSETWIDHLHGPRVEWIHPSNYMSAYGQELTKDINNIVLTLNLDFSQLPGSPVKDPLLINMVQIGIDTAGICDNGGGFPANGGIAMGRKFPVLFAGVLLNDQHMKDVGLWGRHDGTSSGVGVEFQEYQNTFFVDQAIIDLTQTGLKPSSDWPNELSTPGGLWEPDHRNVYINDQEVNQYVPYSANYQGLPEWGVRHSYWPKHDNAHFKGHYRDINGGVYPGIALCVEMLGARGLWNDEAFMQYADRYVQWEQVWETEFPGGLSGNRVSEFINDMWAAYRADFSPVWSGEVDPSLNLIPTNLTVNDFSRDYSIFDSDAARGNNSAAIPLSGTSDSGAVVEARIVTETGTEVVGWQGIATADGAGNWEGTISVARNDAWLRPEVRLAENSSVTASSLNRFASGHVWAIYEQSNWARIFASGFSQTTPDPVLDEEAVQLFLVDRSTGLAAAPVYISDTTPHSAATVAFANAFIANRPNEKLALAAHVASGTSPFEMIDDSNNQRDWSDEQALHNEITKDGSPVGLVSDNGWIAWEAGGSNAAKIIPIITKKLIDGTPLNTGDTVSESGLSYDLDHDLTEFYDWNYSRFIFAGAHGRGASYTLNAGDYYPNASYESMINNWKSALNDQANFPMFLPHAFETVGGMRGIDNGAGGWTDYSHHSAVSKDGLERLAALGALSMLKSANLVSWPKPEFTDVYWAPNGTYVDYWIDGHDITTLREARGGSSAYVRGWAIGRVPTTNANLQPNAGGSGYVGVRITPESGVFDYKTLVEYGQGALPGFLTFPDDYQNSYYLDLPIVDVGQGGIEGGLSVAPRSTEPLPNTLSAPSQFATDGTYFVDPINYIGTGVTSLRIETVGSVAPNGGDRYLFNIGGNEVELYMRSAGLLKVKAKGNSFDVAYLNFDQIYKIITIVDLTTKTIDIDINDGFITWSQSFTTTDTEFASGRKYNFLGKGSSNIANGVWSSLKLWANDPSGTGAPNVTTIAGDSDTVNNHPWLNGNPTLPYSSTKTIEITGTVQGTGEFADYSGLSVNDAIAPYSSVSESGFTLTAGGFTGATGQYGGSNWSTSWPNGSGMSYSAGQEINFRAGLDGLNASAIAGDNYVEITLDGSGETFSWNSVSVELWRNGSGAPTTFQFAIDADQNGYTTADFIGSPTTVSNSGVTSAVPNELATITYDAAQIDTATGSTTVRLYWWDASNVAGNTHITNVAAEYVVY